MWRKHKSEETQARAQAARPGGSCPQGPGVGNASSRMVTSTRATSTRRSSRCLIRCWARSEAARADSRYATSACKVRTITAARSRCEDALIPAHSTTMFGAGRRAGVSRTVRAQFPNFEISFMKRSFAPPASSVKLPDQQNFQCHWRNSRETLTEEIE